MPIGMRLQYSGGFHDAAREIGALQKAGRDGLPTAEA